MAGCGGGKSDWGEGVFWGSYDHLENSGLTGQDRTSSAKKKLRPGRKSCKNTATPLETKNPQRMSSAVKGGQKKNFQEVRGPKPWDAEGERGASRSQKEFANVYITPCFGHKKRRVKIQMTSVGKPADPRLAK